MKRIIGILLLVVLLVPSLRADNWMARLPDDALVAELSIPGAHDAATGSGWAGLNGPIGNLFAKTQDLTIQELWDAGIRAFDLRQVIFVTEASFMTGHMQSQRVGSFVFFYELP